MMYTLAWKEYREHRSVWLTMIIMTGLFGLVAGQSFFSQNPAATLGMTILAMAGVYGVVCGSMMIAGEREGGTLVLLDIFLGRRGLLWLGKLTIGVVLAITEALAVALVLYLFKLAPPDWMATIAGREHWNWPAGAAVEPGLYLWFLALPIVTLEAYAWGLLGSSLTQRVLTGAGLALLMGFHAWMISIAVPVPASIVLRLLVFGLVLFGSCAIFMSQVRDTPMAPSLRPIDPKAVVMRELQREIYREGRITESALDDPAEIPVVVPIGLAAPVDEVRPKPRRGKRPPGADSAREVLMWLTFQQAHVPLVCLGAGGLLVGFFIPSFGQVLWPVATLLLGVACGTATFAFEQSDLSYQFLAAQRFPLKTVWNVKVLFWLTAAVLATLALVVTGGLMVLLAAVAAANNPGPNNQLAAHFEFGALQQLMGPALFFGVWLVYGFCIAQVFVLLCRKMAYAVIISGLVSSAALALWLPTLLCRGMHGWQLWLPPLAMLMATRSLMRAWAAGRIKERKPLAALVGVGAAGFVWALVNFGYRAWEIPDPGEPLDRAAFRAAIPSGNANLAGQRISEALAEMEAPDAKRNVWLAKMAEVSRLPVGVIETPQGDGQAPLLRHLPACRKLAADMLAMAKRDDEPAFDRWSPVLALSRNLRNKTPLASYVVGVEVEQSALEFLENWLRTEKPSPDLLRRLLTELDRHAAETPPALDCLRTECFRAGGMLRNPIVWFTGAREHWLVGGIALSLEIPWESERKNRLWRAVWIGQFRAVQTPHWELPPTPGELTIANKEVREILRGWLPAAPGPGASMNAAQLAGLLDASWLSDGRLFADVVRLRSAATRARWRVDAGRLTVALQLYQLREGKAAAKLDDLVPNYLPELPADPYCGKSYLYRISQGENLRICAGGAPLPKAESRKIEPGQGLLWSTGPDRVDDGGRSHERTLPDDDARWSRGGLDLVAVIPLWR